MKLLLDENLSRRIVPFLQTAFPKSSQVALVGLERASDMEVWRYARDKGYVIVSKDADFYDLSLVHGAPPKVVWLKSGDVTKTAVTRLLLDSKASIEVLLSDPHTTCVELF